MSARKFALQAIVLAGCLGGRGVAWAEESASPLLRPGQVELRLDGAVALLLALEGGVGVEVGVLPLFSGTLSLGAAFSGELCALACWVPNALSERDTSRWERSLVGRLGYHFTVSGRRPGRADLSAFVLGGVTEPHTTVTTPDHRFQGVGRGPVLGLGLGGKYFLSPRFFLGTEARVRASWGTSELTLTRGTHAFTDAERQWLRYGFSATFFVGARLGWDVVS